MKAFKFLDKNTPYVDNKILVLECLFESKRYGMDHTTYIRTFHDTDGTRKIIRDFSIHNFMDYVRIYHTIFNMEGTYGERYSVNIPCDVYEEYLNGILDYL